LHLRDLGRNIIRSNALARLFWGVLTSSIARIAFLLVGCAFIDGDATRIEPNSKNCPA